MTEERLEVQEVEEQAAEVVEAEVVEEESAEKALVKSVLQAYFAKFNTTPAIKIVAGVTGLSVRDIHALFDESPYTESGIPAPPTC